MGRSIRVTLVVTAAVVIVAAVLVAGRLADPGAGAEALRFDGPLVDTGGSVRITSVPIPPGVVTSSTPVMLVNQGTSPVGLTRVEPIAASAGMTIEHVMVYPSSQSGGWSGVRGWPAPVDYPVDTVVAEAVDAFPALGRGLADPDEAVPQRRTLVVAYRLDPKFTSGSIDGLRIHYRYEGVDYALESYSTLVISEKPPTPMEEGTNP